MPRSQSAVCTSWCSCGCGSASCVLLQQPPSPGCFPPLRAGDEGKKQRHGWSKGFHADIIFKDFLVTFKVSNKTFKDSNPFFLYSLENGFHLTLALNHRIKSWSYTEARWGGSHKSVFTFQSQTSSMDKLFKNSVTVHSLETNTHVEVSLKVKTTYLPSPLGFCTIGPADKNAANREKQKQMLLKSKLLILSNLICL